jgi:hypothetical protein
VEHRPKGPAIREMMVWTTAATDIECHRVVAAVTHIPGAIEMAIAVAGLDLAKHVFQIHVVDETGRAVLRRQLRRAGVEEFFKMPPDKLSFPAMLKEVLGPVE